MNIQGINKVFHCRVLLDSMPYDGRHRLVSFVVRYPRRVLAEEVTHRLNCDTWGDVVFPERSMTAEVSKSSASSRAIPLERMLRAVEECDFVPLWTGAQKGMQGADLDDPEVLRRADTIWRNAREYASQCARELGALGIHKQDANRLTEPFAVIEQVVTSSAWDNFFHLRCHEAADPHLRRIARLMYLHYRDSRPQHLRPGQWHLPFWTGEPLEWLPDGNALGDLKPEEVPLAIRHSAARCAWVSYANHDRDAGPEAHEATYTKLIEGTPKHAGPIEHQGTPMPLGWEQRHPHLRSNLPGWLQARKLIRGERCTFYTPADGEVEAWPEAAVYQAQKALEGALRT